MDVQPIVPSQSPRPLTPCQLSLLSNSLSESTGLAVGASSVPNSEWDQRGRVGHIEGVEGLVLFRSPQAQGCSAEKG